MHHKLTCSHCGNPEVVTQPDSTYKEVYCLTCYEDLLCFIASLNRQES